MKTTAPTSVLDLALPANDAGAGTIRDYLVELLATVWQEGEGFSGKRPFGDSSWEYELYPPLIRAGLVNGRLDEDGFVENIDQRAAHQVIADAIRTLAVPDDPRHIIDIRDTGWTIKHPLTCRPGLFECPVNRAAEQMSGPPAEPGRYACELVDGRLVLGDRVSP